MIRTALIGVSGFGATHYADLMRLHAAGRLEFSAATVINQSEEADKCRAMRTGGIAVYDDYHRMLRENATTLDLCCIPTGIALHAPMSCDALNAGTGVLLEKPAAATIQDIRHMQRTARMAGSFVAIGFQDFYRPEIRQLKRQLADGMLGRITRIEILAVCPAPASYYQRNNWAGRLRHLDSWVLDSPFNNGCAHSINLALCLCGATPDTAAKPEKVSAELYRYGAAPDSADTGIITAQLDTVPEMVVAMSRAATEMLPPRIRICGVRGELEVDPCGFTVKGVRYEYADRGIAVRDRMLDHVLRRCAGDETALIETLEQAASHTLLINGAHDSCLPQPVAARRRRRVEHAGESYHVIDDIAGLLTTALRHGKTLHEIAPGDFHAVPVTVDMRGYELFPRRRTVPQSCDENGSLKRH